MEFTTVIGWANVSLVKDWSSPGASGEFNIGGLIMDSMAAEYEAMINNGGIRNNIGKELPGLGLQMAGVRMEVRVREGNKGNRVHILNICRLYTLTLTTVSAATRVILSYHLVTRSS